MKITADLSGLDATIDQLQGEVEAAARPASQAAAEVLYQAVMRNVEAMGQKTGNLRRSIYQVFDKAESTPDKAIYKVSWRTKGSSGLSRAPHGNLLEFGYLQRYKVYLGRNGHWYTRKDEPLPSPRQMPAYAFVRRAQSAFPAAQEAAATVLMERIK